MLYDGPACIKFRILKIANRDHLSFWESFIWKFAESTSDNLDNVETLPHM
jgi:hypothetical protein